MYLGSESKSRRQRWRRHGEVPTGKQDRGLVSIVARRNLDPKICVPGDDAEIFHGAFKIDVNREILRHDELSGHATHELTHCARLKIGRKNLENSKPSGF